jgi:hypothetical protein
MARQLPVPLRNGWDRFLNFGSRACAIYRLLRNAPLAESSHLFAAYELTLHALGLVDRNDPLTAMVADKIIEIGATGLRNPRRNIEAHREASHVQLGFSRPSKT